MKASSLVTYVAAAAIALTTACSGNGRDPTLERLISAGQDSQMYCTTKKETSDSYFLSQGVVDGKCIELYLNPQAQQMAIYEPKNSQEGSLTIITIMAGDVNIEKHRTRINEDRSEIGSPAYEFLSEEGVSKDEASEILEYFRKYLNIFFQEWGRIPDANKIPEQSI